MSVAANSNGASLGLFVAQRARKVSEQVETRYIAPRYEGQPPEAGSTAWSLSAGGPVQDIAVSPTPAAPANRHALTPVPTKKPLGRKTHAKKAGVRRHRQYQTTISRLPQRETARSALGFVPTTPTPVWRPDASAGPNPGGGFYGPPNFEVGRINPG